MTGTESSILRVPAPIKHSRVYRAVVALKHRVPAAIAASRLARIGHSTAAAVRASWLYRWLTAEPDPEVIVIDLRETWTVGPLIAVVDALIAALRAHYRDSATQRLVDRGRSVGRAHPVRLVGGGLLVLGALLLATAIASAPVSSTRVVLGGVMALLGVGGLFVDLSLEEVRATRAAKALTRALAPPEPPDE